MLNKSTISAVGNILVTYQFGSPKSKSEEFAQKRFLKKMELPNDELAASRKQRCFEDFINFDRGLPQPKLYRSNWYKARLLAHEAMQRFQLAEVVFTNGSEVNETFGFNSIESKLMRSIWSCTLDCFDLWAQTAFTNLAIKRCARKRFERFVVEKGLDLRGFHRESWRRSAYLKGSQRAFFCFKRMLAQVTLIEDGSRFSTVRKNNEKDRPIDLQPLCNMLVQRRVGNGIRKTLMEFFGVDLDNLAAKHGERVSDHSLATVDLQNASDSISMKLVEFLLPKRVSSLIKDCRTFMTFGLDGQYHVLNKVSSMGNGFTFELMTLILHCLGVQHDENFSVFGDDILIKRELFQDLTDDLVSVGFVVNKEKSFVDGPFRESCGYNHFIDEGYVRSFDFQYPKNELDCVVLINKAYVLSEVYDSFKKLYSLLLRVMPKPLQGPAPGSRSRETLGIRGRGWNEDLDLGCWVWVAKPKHSVKPKNLDLARVLEAYQITGEITFFYGLETLQRTASKIKKSLRMSNSTGKYMMYLHGGRSVPDVITGSNNVSEVLYLCVDRCRTFRVKHLLTAQKALID